MLIWGGMDTKISVSAAPACPLNFTGNYPTCIIFTIFIVGIFCGYAVVGYESNCHPYICEWVHWEEFKYIYDIDIDINDFVSINDFVAFCHMNCAYRRRKSVNTCIENEEILSLKI
jgi:hypothetical protein